MAERIEADYRDFERRRAVPKTRIEEAEIKNPDIHAVLKSYDILGGQATAAVLVTSERFRAANPKTYEAVLAAVTEAIDTLNADKRAAAELYVQLARPRNTVDEVFDMMSDPDFAYTLVPQKVGKTVQFMHHVGLMKTAVSSWKDLFFPEAHNLPGD